MLGNTGKVIPYHIAAECRPTGDSRVLKERTEKNCRDDAPQGATVYASIKGLNLEYRQSSRLEPIGSLEI